MPDDFDDLVVHLVDLRYRRIVHRCEGHAHYRVRDRANGRWAVIAVRDADIQEHDRARKRLLVRVVGPRHGRPSPHAEGLH